MSRMTRGARPLPVRSARREGQSERTCISPTHATQPTQKCACASRASAASAFCTLVRPARTRRPSVSATVALAPSMGLGTRTRWLPAR